MTKGATTKITNPNTLCDTCDHPYAHHSDGDFCVKADCDCNEFVYNFGKDIQDWADGRHGSGWGQKAAMSMLWGD